MAQVGSDEDSQMLDRETIEVAIREIERGLTRSRKTRIRLLLRISKYFETLAELLGESDDMVDSLLDSVNEIQDLIIGLTNLAVSLSNPPTQICEVYDTIYDVGAYIETIGIKIYTGCQKSDVLFGEVMKDFLRSLIKVSCDNPDTWLYSVLISPIVFHLMNVLGRSDHEDFRTAWCYEISDLMFDFAKSVLQCGDFFCQYYLVTLISCWTGWSAPGRALPVLNSVFSCVEGNARKELLRTTDKVASVRIFLNALNLSSRGPNTVIPLPCIYFFVCNKEIRPPEHQVQTSTDFWVDFSIDSGRLHAFYSFPGATTLASLSIRKDQIDSICLNWVKNDGRSQGSGFQEQDSDTQSTFMKDEKVLFFHIVLSVDFEEVTSDIECMIGKHYRSIYLVFRDGELAEKVMQDMGYNIHECGTKSCERPPALRKLLTQEHKLSYTESWCPESQVFGLDKSLNDTRQSDLTRSRCSDNNETHDNMVEDENQDGEYEEFQDEENPNNVSYQSNISNKSVLRNPGVGLEHQSGSAYLDLSRSHYEDDDNQMENDAFEDDMPNNISNLSIIRSGLREDDKMENDAYEDDMPNNISNLSIIRSGLGEDNQMENDGDMPNNINNLSITRSGLGEDNQMENDAYEDDMPNNNISNLSIIRSGLGEDSLMEHQSTKIDNSDAKDRSNTSFKENVEPALIIPLRNRSVLSRGSDTSRSHVSLSLDLTNTESDEVHSSNNDIQNVSVLTEFEDPLPISAREKYAHLYKHAPFHQSQTTKKFTFVRNSSPKPSAPFHEPVTPPFSIIGSPQRNIWNLTIDPDKSPFVPELENRPKVQAPFAAGDADSPKSSDNESFKSVSSGGGSLSPVFGFSRTLEAANAGTRPMQSPEIIAPCTAKGPGPIEEEASLPSPSSDQGIVEKSPRNSSSPVAEDNLLPRRSPLKDQVCRKAPPIMEDQLSRKTPSPITEHQPSDKLPSPTMVKPTSRKLFTPAKKPLKRKEENSLHDKELPSSDQSIVCIPESPPIEDEEPVASTSKSQIMEKSFLSRSMQRSKRKTNSWKTPCYANSYKEWMDKIKEKENLTDYDPYDLWTSSELDEYRNQLFPKIKTYSKGKKRKRLDGSLGKKLKIVKLGRPKKPDLAAVQRNENQVEDNVNSEDFAFKVAPQGNKYSSIFKKRS